jgi:hypothetical protein
MSSSVKLYFIGFAVFSFFAVGLQLLLDSCMALQHKASQIDREEKKNCNVMTAKNIF